MGGLLMAGDVKPILLRPPTWMADAMTEAAAVNGWSRQEWMLDALTVELSRQGFRKPDPDTPDDQPLPGV
jgi:hypothetical protein